MDDMLRKTVAEARQRPELQPVFDAPIPRRYEPFVQLNTNLGGLPAFAGNRVELLSDYAGAVDCIVQAIEYAQRYVHVEYYIFADDSTGGKVVDALIGAQQRGVVCRVLIDHSGNARFNRTVLERLRAGGVTAHLMLPLHIFDGKWSRFDLRNHRKIVVVDGEVGLRWYAVALRLPAVLSLGVVGLSIALGAPAEVRFSELSPLTPILFFLVIGEELGWHGYTLPRLQARYGALGASLTLGIL